jgi:hypothetical protein
MASPRGVLHGLLNSPRKRRRLKIAAGGVLIVGLGVLLALVFRGTPNAFTDTFSKQPAQLYHPEKTVKLFPEERRLARKFIQTAVERRDLDAAYAIVHPDLKGTMTRKQWDTGNIPVVSYMAENADTAAFVVDYSFKTEALLEVMLIAKRTSQEQRPYLLFMIGLKRAGGNPTGRWLINYWQPRWRPPVLEAVG